MTEFQARRIEPNLQEAVAEVREAVAAGRGVTRELDSCRPRGLNRDRGLGPVDGQPVW